MKTILSLFDYSGAWPKPFADAGNTVFSVDIKSGTNVLAFETPEDWVREFGSVDGIMAAPPCTDFTVSGAQYWGKKDMNGTTAASMLLVSKTLEAVDLYYPKDPDFEGSFFWVLENPVGRLPKLFPRLGKPVYFDPCDFAGYLQRTHGEEEELERLRRKDGRGFEREEVELVMASNCYTKKTGLWGQFNKDLKKKRMEPIRCNTQGSPLQSYGGKSAATKEARSNTPAGFSIAFYEANKDWKPDSWGNLFGPTIL